MTALAGTIEAVDPTLRPVLQALADSGVCWLVLRGRGQLAAPRHDVDLLVAREDLERAEGVFFAEGAVALPRWVHPWHRMYQLDRDGTTPLLLDVVTELIYHRELRLHSRLEQALLERRHCEGLVPVPDPSDLFWTVLLHCLLDKQAFSQTRREELRACAGSVVADSPGERWFASIAPEAPAGADLVRLVLTEEWDTLLRIGNRVLGERGHGHGRAHPQVPLQRTGARDDGDGSRTTLPVPVRGRVRARLALAYPHLWRRVGLGATPRAPGIAGDVGVEVEVRRVVRRPLVCSTVLRVDGDAATLRAALRHDGFLPVGNRWYRPVRTGIERVELVRPGAFGRRRPLLVSFSGLDGAGKTYQIDALLGTVSAEHTVAMRWLPFKIWPEDLLNRLPAGFRSRLGPGRLASTAPTTASPAGPEPVPATDTGHARPGQRRVRRTLWGCIGTMAAVSGGLSLRRRVAPGTTEVLVLDRYRLDAVVKLQFWYPDVPGRWLTRVVDALAPAPDLEFLLRVEPDVAYARKAEQWSVVQLTRQARIYDQLASDRSSVVVLDAQEDPAVVAASVGRHLERLLDGH